MIEYWNDIVTPKKKKVILDTDAYNEVDDQFAIAYAMLSKEDIDLLAICAAPFHNSRSSSAGDGMEKSYNEIFKIRELTDKNSDIPVFRGSDSFLTSKDKPVESEATEAIARLCLGSEEKIYIVAIGAITNVASAIIKYPEIVNKATVIWLGGHALNYPNTAEFNLRGDVIASQVVFDSGIPLVQIPCGGVCTEFLTTLPELRYYLENKNPLCDYLICAVEKLAKDRKADLYGWSKVIWDVTAVAVLTCPCAFDAVTIPRPIITSECRYAFDDAREHYVYVRKLRRDPIYADLFKKITKS